jgi:hypothetical protein
MGTIPEWARRILVAYPDLLNIVRGERLDRINTWLRLQKNWLQN